MEYEADKIIEISLAKIDRNKTSRKQSNTTSTLRRSLLVTSVLKAITTDSLPGKDILMDYRESKIIDLDFDDVNIEMKGKEADCLRSRSVNRKAKIIDSIGHEWKPRVQSECFDYEMKNTVQPDIVDLKGNTCAAESFEHKCDNLNSSLCSGGKAFKNSSKLCSNTPDLRKSLSFKRPRDSDFDMSHMPRPNKIVRFISNDESCELDTQAVSCLETMFQDSFNGLVEQNGYNRPISFVTFPLVSVMAC